MPSAKGAELSSSSLFSVCCTVFWASSGTSSPPIAFDVSVIRIFDSLFAPTTDFTIVLVTSFCKLAISALAMPVIAPAVATVPPTICVEPTISHAAAVLIRNKPIE